MRDEWIVCEWVSIRMREYRVGVLKRESSDRNMDEMR